MVRLGYIIARMAVVAAALVVLCAATVADPGISLHLKRSAPALQATLRTNQTIYIAIDYVSAKPFRLQARAYKDHGSAQGQMMNPSALHPAGKGTALVWVGFSRPAVVDEIHVTAYDDRWQATSVQVYPAKLSWVGKGVAPAALPDWVEELRAGEARLAVEPTQEPASRLAGLISVILGLAVMAGIPAYLVLQALAVLRLEGNWRWAGVAPLLAIVPAALHAVFALSQASNLWPIMIVLTAPLGAVYLAAILMTHRYAGRA